MLTVAAKKQAAGVNRQAHLQQPYPMVTNTKARIERLIKRIENAFPGKHVNWLGPCPIRRIDGLQRALGVRLPQSYREFLRLVGGGGYEYLYITGVRPDEAINDGSSIGRIASSLRQDSMPNPLPARFVPIQYDSSTMTPFCLDTSRLKRFECPVVACDLVTGKSEDVARDFISFYEEYMEPWFDNASKS